MSHRAALANDGNAGEDDIAKLPFSHVLVEMPVSNACKEFADATAWVKAGRQF